MRLFLGALVFLVIGARAQAADGMGYTEPQNLLSGACWFETPISEAYPSMLAHRDAEDCGPLPDAREGMVWLDIKVDRVNPQPDLAYFLILFREWSSGATIQIHYDDGYWFDYRLGPYDFSRYWSVGNFVKFDVPARDGAVSAVLVGLESPTAVRLFRQMGFVPQDAWDMPERQGRVLIGVIVGVLFAMLIYNVVLAVEFRFNFHIHYCLFAFGALLDTMTACGVVDLFFPGMLSLRAQMNIGILSLGLVGLAGLTFLRTFIEDGLLPELWRRLLVVFGVAFFLTAVLYVLMRQEAASTVDYIFNVMSLLGVGAIMATLALALTRGSRAAVFYGLGWSMPVIGVLLRILRGLDLIPHSALVEYGLYAGVALESVILSIGIADRISQIRKERDAARLVSDKATAASAAKSDFLARMSHEIRTPLNAIIGLSHLAAETRLDDLQRSYIRNINMSGNILLGVINDILDFSRAEAGKVELEAVPFRLADVVANMEAVIAPQAREKGLSFDVHYGEGVPTGVIGDPTRLGQVLINLANNAVKFTRDGSVEVYLSAEPVDAHSCIIRIRVRDDGVGIRDAQLPHLFEAFTQADESTTRKYGGSGLGLAICKQLIDLMGGKIWVESRWRAGSSFFVEIPYRLAKAMEAAASPVSREAEVEVERAATSDALKAIAGARILLVEDNPVNQTLATRILAGCGMTVDTANDGLEAVQRANANSYDLILMDIQMPRMDGLAAARSIRAGSANRTTPIIAMTANALSVDREKSLDAGMNHHLTKPFTPDQLRAVLVTWCRPRARSAEATMPVRKES